MSQVQWYFVKDGQEQGPISAQELKEMAARGDLGANDLVRKDGKPEWTQAGKMKGLIPGQPGADSAARSKEQVKEQVAALMEKAHATFGRAQEGLQVASEKADEVAGILWFLDLKFNSYIGPRVIPWIWPVYLVIAPLMYIGGILAAMYQLSFVNTIVAAVGGLFYFIIVGLGLRIALETSMAIFRTAETIKRLNVPPSTVPN